MRPISIQDLLRQADDPLTRAVAASVLQADPYGLVAGGAPTDEYSGEVTEIANRLRGLGRPATKREIQTAVFAVFEHSFGTGAVGTIEDHDQVAVEILRALDWPDSGAG